MQRSLKTEANQVVALQEIRVGENITSEVGRVDAGEGVDFPGVTTHAEELRVLDSHAEGIYGDVGDGVVINWVALVPVVREGFVAGRVFEVRVVSCNRIE